MPIYEYKCKQCGHEFEKLVRNVSKIYAFNCEKCSGKEVERLVSIFAFSGSTDSKSSSASSSSCSSCSHLNCDTCK